MRLTSVVCGVCVRSLALLGCFAWYVGAPPAGLDAYTAGCVYAVIAVAAVIVVCMLGMVKDMPGDGLYVPLEEQVTVKAPWKR